MGFGTGLDFDTPDLYESFDDAVDQSEIYAEEVVEFPALTEFNVVPTNQNLDYQRGENANCPRFIPPAVKYTITAVYDFSTIALAEVKQYLNVESADTSRDAIITRMMNAAKRAADTYLMNPFTKSQAYPPESGETCAIPDDVELWILGYIQRQWDNGANGLTHESLSGVQSMDWTEGVSYDGIAHYRINPGF